MTDDDHEEHEEQSTPGDSSIPAEQEERIINKVVDKVREIVGGGKASDGSGGPGDGAAAPPRGPAASEADMEGKVKAAVDKEITSKERARERSEARAAHAAEHEQLRKAVAEKPPKTYSRLTSAIWGSDDS